MAQRQDRDRERGHRPIPAGPAGIPEEGSPRPIWLKPPPRAKQPRLSWDQIIAAARQSGPSPAQAAPEAPPQEAAAADGQPGAKRRRRRRGRRARGPAQGGQGGEAGAEGEGAVEDPALSEPPDPKESAVPAAAGEALDRGGMRTRRRRGRRGSGRAADGVNAGARAPWSGPVAAPTAGGVGRSTAAVPVPPAPEDDRPVIAIGPPRERRRRPEGQAQGPARPRPQVSAASAPPPPAAQMPAARSLNGAAALPIVREEAPDATSALVRHHLMALRVHPPVPPATAAARAIRHLHGPRVPGAGEPLQPGKVRVIYRDGRELTPCDRKKAEQEVALGRAKWVGASTIRLRYDPFRARRTRRRILERDEGVCAYCGALGDTIDHLTPWSLGGRTTMDNCVTSCAECNFRRGNRPVLDFVAQEGITLRKMRNPVLLEYVRTARAERRKVRPRSLAPKAGDLTVRVEQVEGS